MKKYITAIFCFIVAGACLFGAETPRFGIGVNIGEPIGPSVKFWLNRTNALSFNAGWSFWHEERFHLTGDYLFHFRNAVPEDPHFIPYLGLGGSLVFKEHDPEVLFGVRFGGGLEYLYEPFGFFGELFPVIFLVPETDIGLEGGIGARLYFPIRQR